MCRMDRMKVSILILLAGAMLGTAIPSYADPDLKPRSVLSYPGHPIVAGISSCRC